MSYEYEKQSWENYDKTLPDRVQPDSIITKKRLDHMEDGIEKNSMSLSIGELTLGQNTIPDASITIDEENHEKKLNIVFPITTEINDKTIKDNATWSSRKIRSEIDKIASNTHYTCEITSDSGLLFTTSSDVKTLSAKIYNVGEDITADCNVNDMVWSRKSEDSDYDIFWNGKRYTGRNLVVSSSDLTRCTNVIFYCTYEGVNTEGATISVQGSITLCNMIYESTNTSISVTLDTPNGTIFTNKSSENLIVKCQAYEGSKELTNEDASFRWYLNGTWIPNQLSNTLDYPVIGLPLVGVISCEMTYNLAVYRNSVTVQNRKNVTVSEQAPNDPSIGDVWYDTALNIYKKWTEDGWEFIEDPTTEVSGEYIIAVDSIKTTTETANALEQVRRSTYTTTENGEKIYIKDVYNQFKESADSTERTIRDITNNMGEITESISSVSQKADKFDWIVKSGTDASNMTLTSQFYSLLTGHVDITADKINLNGYTSINNSFWVDEQGVFGAKTGSIGPWNIAEDSIFMENEDTSNNKIRIYMGKEGLNFNDNLRLTPKGGIQTPNFKVDPDTNSVDINATTIKLGGIDVITVDNTIGIRNMILTSGDYRDTKTTYWEYDEIPWTVEIEPKIDNGETPGGDTETLSLDNDETTYITFTKNEDFAEDRYIKIPLSSKLVPGNYVFNIQAFTKKDSIQTLNVYLIDDSGMSKMLSSITLSKEKNIYTTKYEEKTVSNYCYLGFKISEYNLEDTFSIINMSLYKTEIIIKDWYPAPEDNGFSYDDVTSDIDQTKDSIVLAVDTMKGLINQTVSGYVTTDELNDYKLSVATMISQSKESIDFGFFEDYKTETDGRIGIIEKHITFSDGEITLGTIGNQIKMNLSNKELAFIDTTTNTKTAYINNSKMFITDVEILNSLRIGNFSLYPRTSGKLTMKKVS